MGQLSIAVALGGIVLGSGCVAGGTRTTGAGGPTPVPPAAPSATAAARDTAHEGGIGPQYPSTYRRHPNPVVLIRNATIMTAAGQEIQGGSILLRDGRIVSVGTGAQVQAPADAVVVDGTGKWVTPGVIDVHSHLGVYAAPGTFAESDGNEATQPVTAEVWAEHSFWPQDPQIPLAIAGGVTTIQALPGSANLIGGRSAILKLIPARSVQEMKFPGAHYGLKMACGENPKRVYQNRGGPSTRMGNMRSAGWYSRRAHAPTFTPTAPAAFSASIKRPRRQCITAAAPGFRSRVIKRCAGSQRTRHGCWDSTPSSGRSSPEKWPTW